jgi:hypothetical protein
MRTHHETRGHHGTRGLATRKPTAVGSWTSDQRTTHLWTMANGDRAVECVFAAHQDGTGDLILDGSTPHGPLRLPYERLTDAVKTAPWLRLTLVLAGWRDVKV